MSRPDDLADPGVELDPFVGEMVYAGTTSALFVIGDRVRSAVVPLDGTGPQVGIVTGIVVTPGAFLYVVSNPGRDHETRHYAMELIADEDGLA